MKVRAYILTPSAARGITAACAAVLVISGASTARADGVVGTGTAESCTDAALDAALAGGGLVTFNCGGPATIDISTGTGTKTIAADTTIDGGGMVTISGGNSVRVFRVNMRVRFTVQNLTIADGNNSVKLCGSQDIDGGAILNNGGALTVTNSTFSGNSAPDNSVAYACQPTGGGGAISNSGGTLTVTNSTFSGNRAGGGGGIFNSGGTLTVTNSTFSGNSADGGGAIFNNRGTLTVTNSSFSGNSADDGGGIFNGGGTLTVTNNTFFHNSANFEGGGILNDWTLTVTNSTFSGNRAGAGGAISNVGTLTVTNSTFSGNGAFGGGGEGPRGGGAIRNGGTLTVTNTILANSSSGGNCFSDSVNDGGHNIDDGTTCGFSTASLSNTDPQLDPVGLQDHGGPTQTVALCTGAGVPASCTAASPAIDAGDPDICAAAPVNNRDQRGFVRPGASHTDCSIGAYEADATAPVCVGDCDGNGKVAINELVLGVNIVLGPPSVNACPAFVNSLGMVDIAQLIKGVSNALNGCGVG